MTERQIALLGLGNVGRSFIDYLLRVDGREVAPRILPQIRAVADSGGGIYLDRPDEIEAVLEIKRAGGRLDDYAPSRLIRNPREFIDSLPASGVSALVESLPTNLDDGQPALELLTAALNRGVNVVTVDKGPLVNGFDALTVATGACGARLGYTGTTGVAIPEEVLNSRVLEIRGVLNGTTNYILTEMQERELSFEEALGRAQQSGIAEPDPRLDVEGWDSASKILILAKALMQAEGGIRDVSRIGIGPETEELIKVGRASNRRVRLVARARIWQGRVRVSVAPKLVAGDSPFYRVAGTSKAALFRTATEGETISHARSGRDAISEIILDDLIRVERLAEV
ncbi:MAG TPA: hypothetical protein VJQ56_08075 [Blastocatellia bacterium]|nr:hypothetical protein [Blastocatellia bacterium]